MVSAVAELTPGRQGVLHHLHARGGPAIQVRRDQGRDHAAAISAPSSSSALGRDQQGRRLQRRPGRSDDPGAHRRDRPAGLRLRRDPAAADQGTPRTLTIDVTYQINEGQRVYVERIDISGNLRTLDEVIRREFRLAEGDAFNTALLRRSQQRLRNLGFFETRRRHHRAGQRARPGRDQDQGGRAVDGRAVVRRRLLDPGRRAGRHPAHRAQPARPGQDLRANFTVSQRRQQIDLSFTEPYFLERDLAAGFDLFRSRTDFQRESSYDETSTGGTLRARLSADREPAPLRALHAARGRDPERRQRRLGVHPGRGGRADHLAGRADLLLRPPRRPLPALGGLLPALRPGSGGPRLRQPLHPPRAPGRVLLPDHPRRGVQPERQSAGYILGHPRRGRAPLEPLLHRRHQSARLPVRRRRPARLRRPTTGSAAILYYVGSAELRFPLGLPEELRIFGRGFVDAGSLQRHRRQRPDSGREQRPAGRRRRRPVLAVAARAAVDRLRAGDQEGDRRTRPSSSGCPSAPGSDDAAAARAPCRRGRARLAVCLLLAAVPRRPARRASCRRRWPP